MGNHQLDERVREYARRHRLRFNLKQQVGSGTDGIVWATSKNSVIKVMARESAYLTELQCYKRFSERNITEIDGLAVPRFVNCDDDLQIIEITVVHPPFLLDFGKAYIDSPSPYTPIELAEWRRGWVRFFPRSDLARVQKVLNILRGHGIEYMDPRPWNIRFRRRKMTSRSMMTTRQSMANTPRMTTIATAPRSRA